MSNMISKKEPSRLRSDTDEDKSGGLGYKHTELDVE